MLATIVSACVVVAGALLLGQGVLWLCGRREWNWLGGPAGLALMMLIASPALHVPGHATTVAVVLAALLVAAAVLAARTPALRPPVAGLLAAVPVVLLAAVPFLSAGYAGTLGVSLNNDMAFHLTQAEAFRDQAVIPAIEVHADYPLGPHALVGAIAAGTGFEVDLVFAGLTAAIPVLLGLTALAVLPRSASLLGKAVLVTVVGLPYLVAAYYGQGSFKELMQALFVFAIALELRRFGESGGLFRWIPLALLTSGVLSVYSVVGLAWPAALAGVWLCGHAVAALRRGDAARRAVAAVRAELVPLALAAGAVLLVLVPQLPRLGRFFDQYTGGVFIAEDNLGNLAGPLPFWEAFGAWDNADYRYPPVDSFVTIVGTAFVAALVLYGAAWCLRRGDWMPPAAALACAVVWLVSEQRESPYVTAKALVILTPFLLLLAARPLAEVRRGPGDQRSTFVVASVGAVLLAFTVVSFSWDSLRFSPVGPRNHLTQLRSLRPQLGNRPTLYLGNSDFIQYELAGVPVSAPVVGYPRLALRPEKAWQYGLAHDVDSVDAATLNSVDWVITTRDPAGSAMPPQLEPVRRTANFELWRRTGEIQPRATLGEGEAPAVPFDCTTPAGRAIRRTGGRAGVRLGPVGVAAPIVPPGGNATVELPLVAGTWDLALPYTSPLPLEITAPGLRTTLPPNLDRPGPRYAAGRVLMESPGTIRVTVRARDHAFTPARAAAAPTSVIATPAFGARELPIAQACGELVDWYVAG